MAKKVGKVVLMKECISPVTSKACVDLIITDLAVIEVVPEGLLTRGIDQDWTVNGIQALTQPILIAAEDVKGGEL